MNIGLAVCYDRNHNLYNDLNGGYHMRHFYLRLTFGIVWLAAAVVSAVGANILYVALYAVLGIVFLRSAFSICKKEKGGNKER